MGGESNPAVTRLVKSDVRCPKPEHEFPLHCALSLEIMFVIFVCYKSCDVLPCLRQITHFIEMNGKRIK